MQPLFEMTKSRPAAVERAAAKPPAATNPTDPVRKFRNLRVRQYHDGLDQLSTRSLYPILDRDTEPRAPSLFLSSNLMRPVASQFLNHERNILVFNICAFAVLFKPNGFQ